MEYSRRRTSIQKAPQQKWRMSKKIRQLKPGTSSVVCVEASVFHCCAYQIVNDVRVVVDCLVHHEAEDAHLRRAAVVELDCLYFSGGGKKK